MLHCHCTRFSWPLRDFGDDRFDVGLPHLRWAVRATVSGIHLKPFYLNQICPNNFKPSLEQICACEQF
jgi:hypothetical protein